VLLLQQCDIMQFVEETGGMSVVLVVDAPYLGDPK
jgi:hypothetical protein